MVFMALDHSREFFGDLRLQPENLATTTPILFFTRWITHFCAPTFIFLAGVSAWFYGRKVQDKRKLARFLFSRGAWLIFLEFTVVYLGWMQSVGIAPPMFIVIAAIGASMMALSGLIFLPFRVLVALGLAIVLLHNLLDPISSDQFGSLAWLWMFIHESRYYQPWNLVIGYPVLTWIGVIVLGYAFGSILELERSRRRTACIRIGIGCCVAFGLLRGLNLYGDPSPWVEQSASTSSLLAILNCAKYPPSLSFLLMTLGPALVVLALFDRDPGPLTKRLLVLGRVPLFFYVVHLYLIHTLARLLYWIARGEPLSPLQAAYNQAFNGQPWPAIYGFDLSVAYAGWVVVLLLLFPMCHWFGKAKRNGKGWFWTYI